MELNISYQLKFLRFDQVPCLNHNSKQNSKYSHTHQEDNCERADPIEKRYCFKPIMTLKNCSVDAPIHSTKRPELYHDPVLPIHDQTERSKCEIQKVLENLRLVDIDQSR